MTITDEEWGELSPERFDTTSLLRAVDAVDGLRGELSDGDDRRPPQLRDNLLKLHQLAMAVINHGSRCQVADLFDLAVELEDQVHGLMTSLEQLSQLTALHPESLSYAGLGDDECFGWWIVIAAQTPEDRDAVETESRRAAILAQWEVGPGGLDWLVELVRVGKADQLSASGYPNRYTAKAGDVLPCCWPAGLQHTPGRPSSATIT